MAQRFLKAYRNIVSVKPIYLFISSLQQQKEPGTDSVNAGNLATSTKVNRREGVEECTVRGAGVCQGNRNANGSFA
jgi:hypothetical protein